MSRKIVINTQHGGFGVSPVGMRWLIEHGAELDEVDLVCLDQDRYGFPFDDERDHPLLVAMVEEIGERASEYTYATLRVVEIPDDVEWQIEEYDGAEWVAEKHRTWS